ncbi:hypothetical protein ACJJTC_014935 [Scirpophaga incertulas]
MSCPQPLQEPLSSPLGSYRSPVLPSALAKDTRDTAPPHKHNVTSQLHYFAIRNRFQLEHSSVYDSVLNATQTDTRLPWITSYMRLAARPRCLPHKTKYFGAVFIRTTYMHFYYKQTFSVSVVRPRQPQTRECSTCTGLAAVAGPGLGRARKACSGRASRRHVSAVPARGWRRWRGLAWAAPGRRAQAAPAADTPRQPQTRECGTCTGLAAVAGPWLGPRQEGVLRPRQPQTRECGTCTGLAAVAGPGLGRARKACSGRASRRHEGVLRPRQPQTRECGTCTGLAAVAGPGLGRARKACSGRASRRHVSAVPARGWRRWRGLAWAAPGRRAQAAPAADTPRQPQTRECGTCTGLAAVAGPGLGRARKACSGRASRRHVSAVPARGWRRWRGLAWAAPGRRAQAAPAADT